MAEPEENPTRGPGRPAGTDNTARIDARVSPANLATYKEAGGTKWLIAMLDKFSAERLKAFLKSRP